MQTNLAGIVPIKKIKSDREEQKEKHTIWCAFLFGVIAPKFE